jgi:cytochrome b subunit of formate dehydrogenase
MANTLDSIRYNIAKYIQWVVFIGMALAVIGIIITGLLMVTKSISEAEFAQIKSRIVGIVIGVLILG